MVIVKISPADAAILRDSLTYGALGLAKMRDAAEKVGTKHEYQRMEGELNKLYGVLDDALKRHVPCEECERLSLSCFDGCEIGKGSVVEY